jgi:2-oxoglutarate ferredoxin oxidoreductase subunit gamma
VIISDKKIAYPKVIQPNLLVCLTQEAYNKFISILRPGGLLITDTRYVKVDRKVDARHAGLPMHKSVMDTIGKPIVLNICMLGAVVGLTEAVKPESIFKVLRHRLSQDVLEMNKKAFDLGLSMAQDSFS